MQNANAALMYFIYLFLCSVFVYYSLKHVKMVVPTIVMFGVVPQYFFIWIFWRIMSCLLPNWIYQAGDDIYYSVYQKLVLFFFEHVTGTKVSFCFILLYLKFYIYIYLSIYISSVIKNII